MRGVWSLFGHNVPGVKPGTRTPAARVNVLRESMERMRPLAATGGGVNLVQMPNGIADRNVRIAAAGWGKLATSATITAASGATLGSGTVTVCTRSAAALTDTGRSVTVYNAGGAVTATGSPVYLEMLYDGRDWTVVVAPCVP